MELRCESIEFVGIIDWRFLGWAGCLEVDSPAVGAEWRCDLRRFLHATLRASLLLGMILGPGVC